MKGFCTPRGLLIRAAVYVLLFAVAHVAGLRSFTSMLCATAPPEGGPLLLNVSLASTYIITYLLAVVLSPMFIIAAGLLRLWERARVPARADYEQL
jgi:hypothetical protein